LAALYSVKVLRDRGVAFHVVVHVDDLGLTNKDAKAVKQIVGKCHLFRLQESELLEIF